MLGRKSDVMMLRPLAVDLGARVAWIVRGHLPGRGQLPTKVTGALASLGACLAGV